VIRHRARQVSLAKKQEMQKEGIEEKAKHDMLVATEKYGVYHVPVARGQLHKGQCSLDALHWCW
jgi:hypothetical protein